MDRECVILRVSVEHVRFSYRRCKERERSGIDSKTTSS